MITYTGHNQLSYGMKSDVKYSDRVSNHPLFWPSVAEWRGRTFVFHQESRYFKFVELNLSLLAGGNGYIYIDTAALNHVLKAVIFTPERAVWPRRINGVMITNLSAGCYGRNPTISSRSSSRKCLPNE